MYHRIAELETDPWQLAVSPKNFERQVLWLKANRDVVPLEWLLERLSSGIPSTGTVALTFDDGYGDVVREGLPILKKHQCPATIFVATDMVGAKEGFWWDTLARIFFAQRDLPDSLTLDFASRTVRQGGLSHFDSQLRHEVHLELWRHLKTATNKERSRALRYLCQWAGVEIAAPPADRCATVSELGAFSVPGFFDLGAHTASHASLTALPQAGQRAEIAASIEWIESRFKIPVVGLAYPFGDYDGATINAAKAEGLRFACTTKSSSISHLFDNFALPRMQVSNLPEGQFSTLMASCA
jgi:peptidoglycan/xylan/chitin deacetylase (PgdA/CDA1 family)